MNTPRKKEIDEDAALDAGLKEKAEEFVARGGEVYRTTNNATVRLTNE